MIHWPGLKHAGWLRQLFPNPLEAKYWEEIFDRVYQRKVDSWAYVWTFSNWAQSQLSILPRVNLVRNVGFGSDATHTREADSPLDRDTLPLPFPIEHPPTVSIDFPADDFTQKHVFGQARARGLREKLRRAAARLLD